MDPQYIKIFRTHLVAMMALETVSVAMRVFLLAIIVAADNFRLVDWTFSLRAELNWGWKTISSRTIGSIYPVFGTPIMDCFILFILAELLVRIPAKLFASALVTFALAVGASALDKGGLANLCSTYFFFRALTVGGRGFCWVGLLGSGVFEADFRTAPEKHSDEHCDSFRVFPQENLPGTLGATVPPRLGVEGVGFSLGCSTLDSSSLVPGSATSGGSSKWVKFFGKMSVP